MVSAHAATNLYPAKLELELLSRPVHYSAQQSQQVLGLRPSVSLAEGLRQSAAWCRRHGVVA
jgi:hypothetical protein